MRDAIVIEPARAKDLDAIHRLESASFPAPWRREFFASELQGEGRFNIVARLGGTVIGYTFAMWFLDELHVNKIAVDPNERRKGVAIAMMRKVIDFAVRNEVRTISLEVRQSNAGAQAFYESLGFAATYVRQRYYPDGEAAVVMTRELE
jgi:ribosomal-protein-alanine N-acetyltransferase